MNETNQKNPTEISVYFLGAERWLVQRGKDSGIRVRAPRSAAGRAARQLGVLSLTPFPQRGSQDYESLNPVVSLSRAPMLPLT